MRKFRFWHSYTNVRGKHYGASVTDGNAVHVRGWDAGVTVTPRVRGREDASPSEFTDADEFDVYMTWGSHGGQRTVQVGTVRDTEDGPVWVPADAIPASCTREDAPARLRRHRRRRAYTPHSAAYQATIETERTESGQGPAADDEQEDPVIPSHLPTDHHVIPGRMADPLVFGPGH